MSDKLLHKIINTLAGMKDEMTSMKSDIAGLKDDMVGVKSDITSMKGDISSHKETTARIEKKLDATYEQTGKLTEGHQSMVVRLDKLATKEDLEYFDMKIGKRERELYDLKKQA